MPAPIGNFTTRGANGSREIFERVRDFSAFRRHCGRPKGRTRKNEAESAERKGELRANRRGTRRIHGRLITMREMRGIVSRARARIGRPGKSETERGNLWWCPLCPFASGDGGGSVCDSGLLVPLETSQNRNWLLTKAMVSKLPCAALRETHDPCYVSCIRLSASCFITVWRRDSGASAAIVSPW